MWLVLLIAAGALVYAFRGSLTVWWTEVRAAELEQRELVDEARAIAAAEREATIATFLAKEREIDELEEEIARAEAAARGLEGGPGSLLEVVAAGRATVEAERRRLADAVAAFEGTRPPSPPALGGAVHGRPRLRGSGRARGRR